MASRPAKPWSELSAPYRARMARYGADASNWEGPMGRRARALGRGHTRTPEHPERAARNESRYRDYLRRRKEIVDRVIARKERLFGDRIAFDPDDSAKIVREYSGESGSFPEFRRFLKASESEVESLVQRAGFLASHRKKGWEKWSFMFYH